MRKILICVKGGIVIWTAGDPDIQVTVLDLDHDLESDMLSVQDSPDTCVPTDTPFHDFPFDRGILDILRNQQQSNQ